MEPTNSFWILSTIILGSIALLGIAWVVMVFLLGRIKRDFAKGLLNAVEKDWEAKFESVLKKILVGPARGITFFITCRSLIIYCFVTMLFVGITSNAPDVLISIAIGWAVGVTVLFGRYVNNVVNKFAIAELADSADELLKQVLIKKFLEK